MTRWRDLADQGSLLEPMSEPEHGGRLVESWTPEPRLCECPDLCPLHYRGPWRRIDAMRGNQNAKIRQ